MFCLTNNKNSNYNSVQVREAVYGWLTVGRYRRRYDSGSQRASWRDETRVCCARKLIHVHLLALCTR